MMKRSWIILSLTVLIFLLIISLNNGVTSFVGKGFQGILIFLTIVAVASIGCAILGTRHYRTKARAEEEAKSWREKQLLEEKIRHSEMLYRTIVEASHDIIWSLDHRGNFTYLCNKGEIILGFQATDGPTKNIAQVIHPEDLPKVQEILAQGSPGNLHSYDLTIQAQGGKTLALLVNTIPLYDRGVNIGTVSFGQDITAHRQLEKALGESEDRYRNLVEGINDGVIMADENGRLIYVNDKLCEFSGYERDEIIGRQAIEFIEKSNLSNFNEQLAKRKKGEEPTYEITLTRKDGQKVFAIISPKTIFDREGRFKGSFAVITNISDRIKTEEALRDSERHLRRLSAQLLTAQEAERTRISRELHDELGQALMVMKVRLRLIEKSLSEDQTALREECEDLSKYIEKTVEDVRRLSRDLSPSTLEDLGFTAAVGGSPATSGSFTMSRPKQTFQMWTRWSRRRTRSFCTESFRRPLPISENTPRPGMCP
jgi:PAS domain S-box-containing protein